ncbi:MAG TPA: hypothetical protein GXX28_01015 [Firmicutes bacterium]|nr:hypothetical protein [Bacillota bacterium]
MKTTPLLLPALCACCLLFSSAASAQAPMLDLVAQGGASDGNGAVEFAVLTVDRPSRVSWEAAIQMGKAWDVDDPPAFLIGTGPGRGDLVSFRLERGYERRSGFFLAAPGVYYVTARAGHGTRDAAGDIRPFPVYGVVKASLTLGESGEPKE